MDWAKLGGFATRVGAVLLVVMRLFWIPISWILVFLLQVILLVAAPFQWIASTVYHLMALPLKFLARFETIFYYFGTACLIGLFSGTVFYFTTRGLFRLLHMQDSAVPDSKPLFRGRTLASYRAERAQKQAEQALNQLRLGDLPLPSDSEFKTDSRGWSPAGGLARYPLSPTAEKKGLLSTTIFEEEDSSDYTTI